jgi:hypothetical protein
MPKTIFENGTVVTPEFLNSIYNFGMVNGQSVGVTGHIHDGVNADGHAGKIDLTADVMGVLPPSNGGTGTNAKPTQYIEAQGGYFEEAYGARGLLIPSQTKQWENPSDFRIHWYVEWRNDLAFATLYVPGMIFDEGNNMENFQLLHLPSASFNLNSPPPPYLYLTPENEVYGFTFVRVGNAPIKMVRVLLGPNHRVTLYDVNSLGDASLSIRAFSLTYRVFPPNP